MRFWQYGINQIYYKAIGSQKISYSLIPAYLTGCFHSLSNSLFFRDVFTCMWLDFFFVELIASHRLCYYMGWNHWFSIRDSCNIILFSSSLNMFCIHNMCSTWKAFQCCVHKMCRHLHAFPNQMIYLALLVRLEVTLCFAFMPNVCYISEVFFVLSK